MIHLLSIKSEVIIIKLIIEYTTLMVHVQLVHIITEMDSQNHHYFYIDKANYISFYFKSSFLYIRVVYFV
jgi:hypothetical protein